MAIWCLALQLLQGFWSVRVGDLRLKFQGFGVRGSRFGVKRCEALRVGLRAVESQRGLRSFEIGVWSCCWCLSGDRWRKCFSGHEQDLCVIFKVWCLASSLVASGSSSDKACGLVDVCYFSVFAHRLLLQRWGGRRGWGFSDSRLDSTFHNISVRAMGKV